MINYKFPFLCGKPNVFSTIFMLSRSLHKRYIGIIITCFIREIHTTVEYSRLLSIVQMICTSL